MKTNSKKSLLAGLPGAVLALFAFLGSLILLFGIAEGIGGDSGELSAYIISGLFVTVCCFFIVKLNPKSVWYVPLISNLLGIIAAFVEPNFWTTTLWWGLVCGGWGLSLIASIIGAFIGRRTPISNNPNTIYHNK